jgi:hypothetical protein
MSDEAIDPQLATFANKLQGLAPRPGMVNRDRLLFLAGQASARRLVQTWKACAIGSTLAAAVLGWMVAYPSVPTNPGMARAPLQLPATVPPPKEAPISIATVIVAQDSDVPDQGERFTEDRLRRRLLQMGSDAWTPTIHAEGQDQETPLAEEPPTVGSRIWWRPLQP